MVEDVAVALGGGTGIDAADGLRDGRNDEKPPLGKRLAEERGNVPFVPHPPRQDENEGRSSLQENVEDFLLQRILKPAHHAHPFVAHPRRPVETPHHRLRRHMPRRKVVENSRHSPYAHLSTLYVVNLQKIGPYMRRRLICGFEPFSADHASVHEFA